MLYVFHGTDTRKAADRANRLVARLRDKRPDAQVFVFEGAAFEDHAVDELVEARGLFVERHIVVFKQPFETSDSGARLLERLERFEVSENIFVITDGALPDPVRTALARHAEQAEEHQAPAVQERAFNVFALGDALAARNKRELWLLYTHARRAGVDAEYILGTLHWAVRGMLLAERSHTAAEAGQKPFVYSKFKRAAARYTHDELIALSHALLAAYHDARSVGPTLDNALERLTLSLS